MAHEPPEGTRPRHVRRDDACRGPDCDRGAPRYSWGVGVESAIFAENNFFRTDQAISPDMFIERFNGTAIHATGTLVNGFFNRDRVDVVTAWNEVNDPDLLAEVDWVPTLFERIDHTWTVPFLVWIHAGPFFWQLAAQD